MAGDPKRNRRILVGVQTIAALFALLVFLQTVHETDDWGGGDLRARVIGAKVALAGHDPYHYERTPDDPADWFDPTPSRTGEATRLTSTPFGVFIRLPIAKLSYERQKTLWLYVQWALLIAVIELGARLSGSPRRRALARSLGLTLIACGYAWRFHVVLGQVYVLYALLLAIAAWAFVSWPVGEGRRGAQAGDLVAGTALGLLAGLRPSYALALLPFLIWRRFRVAGAAVVALIAALVLPALAFGAGIWPHYLDAMHSHASAYLSFTPPRFIELFRDAFAAAGEPLPAFLRAHSDASLAALLHNGYGRLTSTWMLELACLSVAAIYAASTFAWARRAPLDRRLLSFHAIVLASATDFLLPVARYPYIDVVWLPALGLAVAGLCWTRYRRSALPYVALAAGIAGVVPFPWERPDTILLAEIALIVVMIGTCLPHYWAQKETDPRAPGPAAPDDPAPSGTANVADSGVGSSPRFDAVLFDFDGTLTAPGAIDFRAVREALGCPRDSYLLEFIAGLPAGDERDGAQAMLERFEEEGADRARPMPGAEDVIFRLIEADLPVGLLTRNSRTAVERSLANFERLTSAHFDVVITRDDGVAPKPAPDAVLLAAERMGVGIDRLLMVGDFILDVQAGRAAGAGTAYLEPAGETSAEESGADAEAVMPTAADYFEHRPGPDDCDFFIAALDELIAIVRLPRTGPLAPAPQRSPDPR